MTRIRISRVLAQGEDGQSVTISGWVRSKRVSKNFAFLVINDGSSQTDIQCIIDADKPFYDDLGRANTGASVRIDGVLKESPGKGQAWEVQVDKLEVVGESGDGYPLQKKGHSMEFLREIAHIRGRSNTFGAVYRVRNQLAMMVHEFFQSRGFQWAHTPILTASDCEGAGEMFQVTTLDLKNLPKTKSGDIDYTQDFFGKATNLTVSGQLNGEALALSLGDIYTFGPTFRAENSNTTRHLAEFWMVEPEMAFANLHDNSILAEEFLRFMFTQIAERCEEELSFLGKHFKNMSSEQIRELGAHSFGRISYSDAIKELESASTKFEFPVEWGIDLQTEHEKYLSEEVFKKPVIVTDYPKDIKAFYMKLNGDDKTVAAMDVLVPRIGEIIGGSQREDRYDVLKARMEAHDIPVDEMRWYLELRKYGGCPHAGFGLGFERLVQYVTGMGNIRDVIPFPRVPQSIDF
ncbi:asparagine--tRNA ligase [Pseudobacteriovorax antillogorgiicola]|uniref:Asparagine--tRNA ligase n=1 Tax=Pseudobacteriovorax antillogorgiicola TaxID=1513793 RepID=A0A1Y6B948_9BACT|nr:asparagine--tRNA ligase [Pseudobacteriovorax antillogorgiicola]TCS59450.1 asparaginyl-tRNA synthetase [Pseudobacteriovorax antillogorgiicola]SME88215.1 asparaginyl-tRNA synthetase [Pseudobacteriovorax antillogorgiicola]